METAILISSCDLYSDCWLPMIYSLRKNWPECPYPVFIVSNYRKLEEKGINFTDVGEDKGFGSNTKKALELIKADYVIFFLDDFFLNDIDKEGDAFQIIKERGHSFPVLICKDIATLKALNITCYPTVLVVNREGELVFRGDIEDADKKIEELLKENR